MRMCLVSAKNKPSSDKGHVQEPQLHFYLHQQVLSTIENTDASPVATTKQRKAPPSPSSLGLWSTSSSNSPIRKIKSMPRSRLEFPRPVS
ncbi:uncharacterized protein OCT59_005007 [Rhizophagus irregularis]|uniref:uncharacterized protein n=1 Tax=Rhizophagus irregularis TaxID=588596 RepID=UPI0033291C4B|nr:hypothetical protein OCT59_005007 [Rhizophagus irregularis]